MARGRAQGGAQFRCAVCGTVSAKGLPPDDMPVAETLRGFLPSECALVCGSCLDDLRALATPASPGGVHPADR